MTWHTSRQKKCPPSDSTQPIPPRLRLKQVREAQKIRQKDIAAYTVQLGPEYAISKTLLSHVECGRSRLTVLGPKRLAALREALGMTADEWATQIGNPDALN